MSDFFKIDFSKLNPHIPPGTPQVLSIETGLPPAKRLWAMLAGSGGPVTDVRQWLTGTLTGALRRVEELEAQIRQSGPKPSTKHPDVLPTTNDHDLKACQELDAIQGHLLETPYLLPNCPPGEQPFDGKTVADLVGYVVADMLRAQKKVKETEDRLDAMITPLLLENSVPVTEVSLTTKLDILDELLLTFRAKDQNYRDLNVDQLRKDIETLRAENESFRTKPDTQFQEVHTTLVETLGVQPGGSVVEAVEDLQKAAKGFRDMKIELDQLRLELKFIKRSPAETRAQIYYTNWKSMERKLKDLTEADTHKLSVALSKLVTKGFITQIEPGGMIPTEVIVAMIAGVIHNLPNAEDIPITEVFTAADLDAQKAQGIMYHPSQDQCSAHCHQQMTITQDLVREIKVLLGLGEASGSEEIISAITALCTKSYPMVVNRAVGDVIPMEIVLDTDAGKVAYVPYQRVTEAIQKGDEWMHRYNREVEGLNNEGDPIGGDPPCGLRQRVERDHAFALQLCELLNIGLTAPRHRDIPAAIKVLQDKAAERDDEVFFKSSEGYVYSCDNMSIGPNQDLTSITVKITAPDGTDRKVAFFHPRKGVESLLETIRGIMVNHGCLLNSHTPADVLVGTLRETLQDKSRIAADLAHQMVQLDCFRTAALALTKGDSNDEALLRDLKDLSVKLESTPSMTPSRVLALPGGRGSLYLQALQGDSTDGISYMEFLYDGDDVTVDPSVSPVPGIRTPRVLKFIGEKQHAKVLEGLTVKEAKLDKMLKDAEVVSENPFAKAMAQVFRRLVPRPDEGSGPCPDSWRKQLYLSIGGTEAMGSNHMEARGYDAMILQVPSFVHPTTPRSSGFDALGEIHEVKMDSILILVAWTGEDTHPFQLGSKALTIAPTALDV